MKKLIIFISIITYAFNVSSQGWSTAQISTANTANDIEYLTAVEKEVIMYINLCRLYPKEFIKFELVNYFGTKKYGDYLKKSNYRNTLIDYLKSMQALQALTFDSLLYRNAKCFAKEQGEAGTTGHQRINCPKENYAECCSYGMDTGKDIALQLLIDDKVPSLGHRKICLDKSYNKIGVSINYHKKWEICAVVNLIW